MERNRVIHSLSKFKSEITPNRTNLLCRVFLEENVLQDIISIIKQSRSNKIKIQIIQTISILIQNIKNRTSLCTPLVSKWVLVFILSNNHINDLITTPLDFMDEDVVSQYISFLKLLSMNLTTDTIQFFYNYVTPIPFSFNCRPNPLIRSPCFPSAASSTTTLNRWCVLLSVQSLWIA